MTPSRLSYVFLLSFIIAVFALQWVPQDFLFFVSPAARNAALVFLCLFCLLLLFCLFTFPRHRTTIVASFLSILLATLSVLHASHLKSPSTLDWYGNGRTVTLHGFVIDEPDRRPTYTQYTVAVDQLEEAGTKHDVTGTTLVRDNNQWPEIAYGQEIIVRGRLLDPAITNPSYAHSLWSRGIRTTVERATVQPGVGWRGSRVFDALFTIRETFEAQINRIFPEPHASLMAGLLTGSRRGIPQHLADDFRTVGLTHIIAISGSNITIVALGIGSVLFFLPLFWRLAAIGIAVTLFTLCVGASASVVRAAIMGILGLIALSTGRRREMRLTILWTAFGMLLWNPLQLWYDAGFQLSFLAILGITELTALLEPLAAYMPDVLGIRTMLITTTAAQLMTLPWTILLFGRLPLLSLVANILVLPFVPIAMLLGFVGTVVSFLWFELGQLLSYTGWGCLHLMIRTTEIIARVPYASPEVPPLPAIVVVLCYVGLGTWITIHTRTSSSPSSPTES